MDKKEVKTFVNGMAAKAAETANAKAKASSGWQRWLWAIGAIIAGAVAFFTTGCESVTPAQIHAAHAVYHLATGKQCVIEHAEK